jgi:ABC-type Fe3+-hydroxamate transport system substrate-binding protein
LETPVNTNTFVDQLGNKIKLSAAPLRIISLVPSQTELLFDLGLRDEVVGITKFCVHPNEWFRSKTRVGGTKKIDFEKVKQLNPDLIIGNKEENEKGQIEELEKHYNVWMSDIYTLKDALEMIVRVGTLVSKQQEAILLKLQVETKFNQFKNARSFSPHNANLITQNSQLTVAYFIWNNPYMVAAKNTFIDDMLTTCGFHNVFASADFTRYPEVNAEQIAKADPQVILLSSEPYPFKEKHIQMFQAICPNAKIIIVDGEIFSWYGSRLLKTPHYFDQLISQIN